MVEPIYFLKPAWCGNHLAGLRPEIGLTARYCSHRLPGGGLSLDNAPYSRVSSYVSSSDRGITLARLAIVANKSARATEHRGDGIAWREGTVEQRAAGSVRAAGTAGGAVQEPRPGHDFCAARREGSRVPGGGGCDRY